jgi:DNA-binding MarR family transcriptional regulator
VSTPGRIAVRDDSVAAAVDAFRRILRELRVAARKTELATGLSAAQLFVLTAVLDAPECSLNDIARATMTDRTSVAAIVDRLVDQGYVTRKKSGDDKRRASIAPTSRGRRAAGRSAPAPTALLLSGLRALTSVELQSLSTGLTALTQAMGITDSPADMLFEDARASARAPRSAVRRKS